jgi:hypothetical protein
MKKDLISILPADMHDHQSLLEKSLNRHHNRHPLVQSHIKRRLRPLLWLFLVTLPPPLPSASKSPPNLLTSESGLDALERRLLAKVGTRTLEG